METNPFKKVSVLCRSRSDFKVATQAVSLFPAAAGRDLHSASPSQICGENGLPAASVCSPQLPSPKAEQLSPAQGILFLPSHQLHHLQSHVPLVGRNLEPSGIQVSTRSLPGAGVGGGILRPRRVPTLCQQPGRTDAPGCTP